MTKQEITTLRLDEFCALPQDTRIPVVDIQAFNVPTESLAAALRDSPIHQVIALDISRLGVEDADVEILMDVLSKDSQLRWLKLAYNTDLTQKAVVAICSAVRSGLDLHWVDLQGTKFDATPYFEDPITQAVGPKRADGSCMIQLPFKMHMLMWRVPRCTYKLAEEWGWQRWMTMGLDPAGASEKYILERDHPGWVWNCLQQELQDYTIEELEQKILQELEDKNAD